MKLLLSVGQTNEHEDGDQYELVKLTRDSATLVTEEGSILHMTLEDMAEDLENEVLVLTGEENEEEEGEDDDD